MKRKELEHVKKVLEHIKNPDSKVALAIAYVEKDIKQYEGCKGQLLEQYDHESRW